MKVFYNSAFARFILLSGHSTIALGCLVFTVNDKLPDKTLNHEAIHVRQWVECMVIYLALASIIMLLTKFLWWVYLFAPLFFYVLYLSEYWFSRLYRLFGGMTDTSHIVSYRSVSFEMEAKVNENYMNYLKSRKWLSFIKYYGKL